MPARGRHKEPWSLGDYLVVLDAYLEHRDQMPDASLRWVREAAARIDRTEASVVKRVLNYIALDPEQPPDVRGLDHGGPRCRQVFEEWMSKGPKAIAEDAHLIRRDRDPPPQMRLLDSRPVRVPSALAEYELGEWLGAGGFADVYSCIHETTGDEAAIKIIKVHRLTDRQAMARFRREIRALRDVRHRHVLRLREDYLDEEEVPAFVMDKAACSLTEYAARICRNEPNRRRPFLAPKDAVLIVRAMLEAAAAIHGHTRRIVHRDINPNNILMLADGTWVLADFGLCKFIGPATTSTSFETLTGQQGIGTGYYTAPEQWRDLADVDERTDVYALGTLVWELFTCEGPPPDTDCLGLPCGLARVFADARARDRDERIPDVGSLRERFEEALRSDGILVGSTASEASTD